MTSPYTNHELVEELLTATLDDPFDTVVREIVLLNRRKRSDYAGSDGPWQNFIDSSRQTGDVPGKSVEILIATKQARLRHLLFGDQPPQNEAVRDSLLDRAVYSIIALAMYDEGHYRPGTDG